MDLKELASKAINDELDLQFEHHPVHAFIDGSTEINENLLAFKGIAGFYVLDTEDGLVLLDTGSILDVDRAFEDIRNWRPDAPLKAAIYTHHHVDHVFAVEKFDHEADSLNRDRPIVYAHKLLPDHFDRYKKTLGWNTAINRRQFAINVPQFSWPDSYRYPDILVDEKMSFKVGETEFFLNPARGETDDHLWAYIPQEKILLPGDLFIWAVPNGGNPQKVQRYISDWATALREMAELDVEIMLPGHGYPMFGAEIIKKALETTATFLDDIEEQVLSFMNRGKTLDFVIHNVKFDTVAMKLPWLKPVYDDPQFLIRMIWRRYGGWWDGEYDRLFPTPRSEEAKKWLELVGSLDKIIDQALVESEAGNHNIAAHLIETALHANPDSENVHSARIKIFSSFSKIQSSSMGRNILNHASLASLELKRDLAED